MYIHVYTCRSCIRILNTHVACMYKLSPSLCIYIYIYIYMGGGPPFLGCLHEVVGGWRVAGGSWPPATLYINIYIYKYIYIYIYQHIY